VVQAEQDVFEKAQTLRADQGDEVSLVQLLEQRGPAGRVNCTIQGFDFEK
jgi:hypothetical protein